MKVILREFVWTSVFLLKRLIKHGHYFHVISCGINKYIHNSLFSLDSDIPKLNTVKDNPEKTLRKNLTTTPFSYINDASVDLNLSLPESVLARVLWGEYTFWVCGTKLTKSYDVTIQMRALCLYSDTRWYLFFRIWENEVVTFGWNLLLAKFGSEKVERRLSPYNLPLSKGTSYCQWRFFPGFAVPSEFPFIAGSGMKSLFTGNDSSSDTAVSSAPVIYSFMSFFFC